jgi:hypothetical protein
MRMRPERAIYCAFRRNAQAAQILRFRKDGGRSG